MHGCGGGVPYRNGTRNGDGGNAFSVGGQNQMYRMARNFGGVKFSQMAMVTEKVTYDVTPISPKFARTSLQFRLNSL